MKSFNVVKIIISGANQSSGWSEKTIVSPTPEMLVMKVDQEIDIEFKEIGESGSYEIIKVEEKWDINDKGDETITTIYTVKYIPKSRKILD